MNHFSLLDYAILVDIIFWKESVELFESWWSLSLSCKHFIEEVSGLNLVKDTALVEVIVLPDLVNQILDLLFLILWGGSHISIFHLCIMDSLGVWSNRSNLVAWLVLQFVNFIDGVGCEGRRLLVGGLLAKKAAGGDLGGARWELPSVSSHPACRSHHSLARRVNCSWGDGLILRNGTVLLRHHIYLIKVFFLHRFWNLSCFLVDRLNFLILIGALLIRKCLKWALVLNDIYIFANWCNTEFVVKELFLVSHIKLTILTLLNNLRLGNNVDWQLMCVWDMTAQIYMGWAFRFRTFIFRVDNASLGILVLMLEYWLGLEGDDAHLSESFFRCCSLLRILKSCWRWLRNQIDSSGRGSVFVIFLNGKLEVLELGLVYVIDWIILNVFLNDVVVDFS